MLSYHNDALIKAKHVQRFAAHRAADEVIQGTGFEDGHGCFVGCTLDDYDHSRFPVELGWPEWLAHLTDKIFEGLPQKEAAQFGTDLLDAVPVGVDLEPVRFIVAIERHQIDLERLKDNQEDYAQPCRNAIQGVINWRHAQLAGTADEAMRETAWSAAWSAARSVRSAAAWSTESSEESARSAAFQRERYFLLLTVRSMTK